MFYELGAMLYSAFTKKAQVASVPTEYIDIAERVAKKLGWNTRFRGIMCAGAITRTFDNNAVMVALSGGLDSVYLMQRLKQQGYDVHAVHIAGLNKSTAIYEQRHAQKAAAIVGAKYTEIRVKTPKQAYPDNPFKNQLILSLMLDYGAKKGVYRYAIGSDWTTPLSEAVVGYTVTDSAEVNAAFWNGIKKRFPQAELVFIPDDERKRNACYICLIMAYCLPYRVVSHLTGLEKPCMKKTQENTALS